MHLASGAEHASVPVAVVVVDVVADTATVVVPAVVAPRAGKTRAPRQTRPRPLTRAIVVVVAVVGVVAAAVPEEAGTSGDAGPVAAAPQAVTPGKDSLFREADARCRN